MDSTWCDQGACWMRTDQTRVIQTRQLGPDPWPPSKLSSRPLVLTIIHPPSGCASGRQPPQACDGVLREWWRQCTDTTTCSRSVCLWRSMAIVLQTSFSLAVCAIASDEQLKPRYGADGDIFKRRQEIKNCLQIRFLAPTFVQPAKTLCFQLLPS